MQSDRYLDVTNIVEELEGIAANSAIAKAIATFISAIDEEQARCIVTPFNSASMCMSFHCVVGRIKAMLVD
jgi:hypothetical protein